MKAHYEKTFRYRNEADFTYSTRYNYYRPIRTFPELRENAAVYSDLDLRDLKVFTRGHRNSNILDAWNDFVISRSNKKSWKDFTKNRKQWMETPEPSYGYSRWRTQPRWVKNDQRVSDTGKPAT